MDDETLLVKPDVAEQQLEEEQKTRVSAGEVKESSETKVKTQQHGRSTTEAQQKEGFKPRRFYGSVALDPLRIGTQAGQIGEEVIQHLAALPSAHVEVTLEIQIEVPDGIPNDKVRIVTENCRTLGFDAQEFEEE